MILRLSLVLLLTLAFPATFAWAQWVPAECADTDVACATKAGQDHVVKKLAFWKRALSLPVEARMAAAPPELVDFLRLDNIAQSIQNRPRVPVLALEFEREAMAAFDELPRAVKDQLATKLVGIYFIEDIGGTGYTDVVYDPSGNPVAGFIVLDPSVLQKLTANGWATWKENTPFKASADFRLSAEIEAESQDTRKNAIQYILLHEMAHVISIGGNIHPSWNVEPREIASFSPYPFFRLSWKHSQDRNSYVSLFDGAFPQRKDVVYYFGARLPAEKMVGTYENLERTNFVTLYGATRPGDDFAEAFASYVHTVLMKRPFSIRIYHNEKQVKTYEACWNRPRCAAKQQIIQQLLAAKVSAN
jgi:hypothetical protein